MFYCKKYKDFLIRRIFDMLMLFYKPDKGRLKKILSYCSENIDFYKGRGSALEGYDHIDKKVLMDEFERFVRKGFTIKNTGLTSGTTGTPGRFFRDIRSMVMEQYFQDKYFKWRGTYKIIFRGERLFDSGYAQDKIYRTIPLIREMYVSSFHINDQSLKNLVERIRDIPGKSLWAYPSSAYMLAEYCLRNDLHIRFEVVALSSEMLMDYQRRTIEKAFDCRVKDWYGQAERVAALVRCEHGRYHEMEGYSNIEYLPASENMFEISGTTLYNKVMPLVRYNVHDLVELSGEACPCGDKGRNIVKIHGRNNSYIELPNGRLYESALTVLFKGMDNIIEAQILQRPDKKIAIRVVRDRMFDEEDERALLKHISNYISEGMFFVEYTDRIERDSRGKFRFVVNEALNQARKDGS